MPELPEVEVLRRGLHPQILGLTVAAVTVREPHLLQNAVDDFQQRLIGQAFTDTQRRGKYLLLVAGPETLVVHLRMTGQLTYHDIQRPDSPGFMRQPLTGLERHPIDRHTHVIVSLANGCALYYRDTRKFGRLQVWPTSQLKHHPALSALGIEPLDSAFTFQAFQSRFKHSQRAIKPWLLDQQHIAGLGNIYCDEALFHAQIHPLRAVSSLTLIEQKRLFQAIPHVLQKGIAFGGTTLRDYVQSDGQRGSHQDELLVYGCQGKLCTRCGTPIQKLVVAQRGTHICPTCQQNKKR